MWTLSEEANTLFIPTRLQTTRKTTTCFSVRWIVSRNHPRVQTGWDIDRGHSEAKLNDISQKLDQISLAIDNITTLPHQSGGSSVVHTTSTSHVTPQSNIGSPSELEGNRDDVSSELDGDVTLTTQATFATNFLQQVVDNNKGSDQVHEFDKSLEALRKILGDRNSEIQDPQLVDTQQILSPAGQGGYQFPPVHLAMMAIQRLRGESHNRKRNIQTLTLGQSLQD